MAAGRTLLRTRGTDITGGQLPAGLRGLLVWGRWVDHTGGDGGGVTANRELVLKLIDADHTFAAGDTFTANGHTYTVTGRFESTSGWSRYGIARNAA